MKYNFLLILGLIFISSTVFSKSSNFEVIGKEVKNMNVEIDTKLELFLIMAHLGENNNTYLNGFDYKYKRDIDRYFAAYKEDKDVVYLNKVLQNYHAHITITQFIFDPKFRENERFSNFLDMGALGMEHSLSSWSTILNNLNDALEQFAETSDFEDFVSTHKDYYTQKVNEVADAVSGLNMIDDFYDFWGSRKDRYTIVVSMLETDMHAGWFDGDQGSECIFFLPPKFVVDNDAVFGNDDRTNMMEGKMSAKDYIYYAATHELGHPILDPLMDKYVDRIEAIPFKVLTFAPSRTVFLCESFLRALTAYYLQRDKKEEMAQMILNGEISQGYIYSKSILELIHHYSNNRDEYKNFEEYIPDFLTKLEECVRNQQSDSQ